ncbi:MAG: aromatic amino acid transport family protein [Francisellaceae bacterium]
MLKTKDYLWVLSLFATAFGAGVLYIPVTAIEGSTSIIIVVGVIAAAIIGFGHVHLANVILKQKTPATLSEIIYRDMGKAWGNFFSIVFFLATFTILVVYSIGILQEYVISLGNLFGFNTEKWHSAYIISFFVPLFFVFLSLLDTQKAIKIISSFIFVLIAAIVFISLYLSYFWQDSTSSISSSPSGFVFGYFTLMVFAMNFSPIIPRFATTYHHDAKKARLLILLTCLFLTLIICLFILACKYALPPDTVNSIKENPAYANASILTILAMAFPSSQILHYLTPAISMLVLTGAFIGTFFGAEEATENLVKFMKPDGSQKAHKTIATLFMLIIIYGVLLLNLNIKSVIGQITSPCIIILLFVIPTAYFYKRKNKTQRLHATKAHKIAA